MTKRFFAISLASAAIAASGLACGSDGDDTGSSSNDGVALTKVQFVQEANAICVKTIAKQASARKKAYDQATRLTKAGGSISPAERRAFIQAVIEPLPTMVDELSSLAAPSGDEQAVEKIVDQYEQGVQEAEDRHFWYLSGKAFKKANDSAEAYGLKKCKNV